MATLATIKLDKNASKKIARLLAAPFDGAKSFFDLMGVFMDRSAMLTFRGQGARAGHKKWRSYSQKTVKTKKGTWKIRYGTDLKGRAPGTYVRGKLRPGVRRFSGSSKLLQASGMFRQSFRVISTSKRNMVYGTKHRLAEKIMRLGRQVLFIMPSDYIFYSNLFRNWYLKAIQSGAIR